MRQNLCKYEPVSLGLLPFQCNLDLVCVWQSIPTGITKQHGEPSTLEVKLKKTPLKQSVRNESQTVDTTILHVQTQTALQNRLATARTELLFSPLQMQEDACCWHFYDLVHAPEWSNKGNAIE